MKSHTNWFMPMGVRECNLNIQHNSMRLCLEVLDGSNFGVHHSSTVNCMCLCSCPSLLKHLETGVICPSFWTLALCSYILFLSALDVSPTLYFWYFTILLT